MTTPYDESNVIRVEGVTKHYGRVVALDGIDMSVRRGDLFALLGPNGAGKTTLVQILCTILAPDGGRAEVAGYDVVEAPLRARRGIGVVFQEPSLDDRLTVDENLDFHGQIYGVPRRLRRERIRHLLSVVELEDWREHVVRALSSGMKRRLEIARALVHDSRILFLDEPTVGLDAQSRERIWQYLERLRNERELTVLVTTHYIGEVEGCDRVCVIDHGRILADDAPEALKREHGQRVLRIAPRDDEAKVAITTRYADHLLSANGEVVLDVDEDGMVEGFLANFGSDVRSLTVETPSLENVFLSLTGRELRDHGASARDVTYAFGRRGGEHTR